VIVTRRVGIKLAAILLATVVVQVSFFSYLQILGTTPDITPVVVGGLGLLGGGVVGAVCGFATGLALDATLLQTLGVSSLILLSIGYLAGRYRETTTVVGRYAPAAVVGGLTLLGAAALAAIELTLGVDTPISGLILREIVVKGLLAFVLALGIVPILRFALRAALVEDEYGAPIGSRPPARVLRRVPSIRMPRLPKVSRRNRARTRARATRTRNSEVEIRGGVA
jgi:rod shape-determining protein MreD